MTDKNREPIRSMDEWTERLFPEGGSETSQIQGLSSPAELAAKWAINAIKSLPNKPIKPTQ